MAFTKLFSLFFISLDNVIIETDFRQYMKQYENQLIELERHIHALSEPDAAEFPGAMLQDSACADEVMNYINMDKLDRYMIVELIDRIEVGRDGELTIYYKFGNNCAR